jgi:drug/metabolite transporter (DMT)-like permease
MPTSNKTVNRPLVGSLALGLLGFALVLSIWPGMISGPAGATLCGVAARVGIVMAALWLALPSRGRPAAWANLSTTSLASAAMAVMAIFRVPFRIMIPLSATVMVLGFVLRPKPLQRPERRADV